MTRFRFLVSIGLFLFFSLLASVVAQERVEYVIIVNEQSAVDSLAASTVSRMFLKKLTRWESGEPVYPVDQSLDSNVREAFSQSVLKRSQWNVTAYWQRKIFTGSAVPPPVVDDDAAVIAYVREHAGGIGYVSKRPSTGVKVIAVTGVEAKR